MKSIDKLEDYIGEILSSDTYYENIQAKLDGMPRTRAAADELLSALISYDEPLLYVTLLREYGSLLTAAETAGLREKYNRNFDLPLSCYGIE